MMQSGSLRLYPDTHVQRHTLTGSEVVLISTILETVNQETVLTFMVKKYWVWRKLAVNLNRLGIKLIYTVIEILGMREW